MQHLLGDGSVRGMCMAHCGLVVQGQSGCTGRTAMQPVSGPPTWPPANPSHPARSHPSSPRLPGPVPRWMQQPAARC